MVQIAEVPNWQIYAAVVVFLAAYGMIITDKIHRAVIALAGAAVIVALGIVPLHAAYVRHIEWNTIFLLVGMMILVGISNRSGVFQYIAVKAAQKTKGDPVRLLVLLSLITGIISALLDNVTTVLLLVPVTFSITKLLKLPPVPYLIAEIIASNIGGTATLIGDPPNVMIGSANRHLTFNDFLINLGPIALLILVVTLILLALIYSKQLRVEAKQKEELMRLKAEDYISNRPLMIKSVIVLSLTIIGFLLHPFIHLDVSVVALLGAVLLLLIGTKGNEPEEVFHSVEWGTIFFFAGLFVLVGGLVETGIVQRLAERALEITSGDLVYASMLILWVSGIASATIDNIPFVATMIPLIQEMGVQMNAASPDELNPVWWSLALGACLGGNGTLIGASANVIVAGLAAREGHGFSYLYYLKIGAPLTLLALILSTFYVLFFLV
jgi:Na+/H+ antiporter NhaD/arsenite permease-like protein